ncbi:zinc protease [Catalinimonas alkaloidigena]|uniref:Zinc protease n=1 Tax=Catalinimonas alkaloidigena TaxID=1075417 RepID=A0A1G9PFN8_9BACT|nr:pitrilysin family protein [Catalinimonas alkaloidigena]SDL97534.1 zinc protease [Catalinimonas alkaloidigena]
MRALFYWPLLGIVTLLLAAGCRRSTLQEAPSQAETSGVFPYSIHQKPLPNGLNVVTVPYDSPGLASFYLVVRVGSREEVESGKSGFAHFFEHMMFRGTDRYPKDRYGEVLKGIGAAANANTWWDRTVYHMTGNADMLETMFELEADRFQHLNYSEADFKVEAGAVKGEYTKSYASPSSKLYVKTYDQAFDQHTYQHTTIGFWEDVVDMPNQYAYSKQFYDRFYRPEYTTLLVVGDVTPEQVNHLAEQYFGDWERGNYQPTIPTEPEQTATRYAHEQAAGYPPTLSLNYKSPAFSVENKDKAALDLLAMLAFSPKSDIYRKLVIDEQKARNLGAYALDTRDPGLFTISASLVKADDLPYVKAQLDSVIQRYREVPVKAKALGEAQSRLKYSFAMDLDSPSQIAEALSQVIWLTGDPTDINRLFDLYDAVMPEDLQRVARQYLVDEHLTLGTISPAAESPFASQRNATGTPQGSSN